MHPDQAELSRLIDAIEAAARRADQSAIDRGIDQLAAADMIDEPTRIFLLAARSWTLDSARCLSVALNASDDSNRCLQSFGSAGPSPAGRGAARTPAARAITAAGAWDRARRNLPDDQPILVHVQEFEDGFMALPIMVDLPEPPLVPSTDTVTMFVVDKVSGAVTRWPLLRPDVLTEQYRRYRRREPMTFDESDDGSTPS